MIQEDVENEYVKVVDEKKAVNQNIQFDFKFYKTFLQHSGTVSNCR